jgi:hypothetical protein
MALKITGEMRLYCIDKKTGKIYNDTGFLKNKVVETGKEFILDEITNNDKWNSGLGIQAVALGDSTDNIDTKQGPAAGIDILIEDDGWNDVVDDDWRLASEIARSSIVSVSRVDQTTTIVAAFTDAQFTFTGGPPAVVKIREAGIFLHATTAPTANPQSNPSQKPYAMVARKCYWGYDDPLDPQYYVDRPYYKLEDGNTLMYEYRLTLG